VLALNDVTCQAADSRPSSGKPALTFGAPLRRQISGVCSPKNRTYRNSNRILDCRKMSDDQQDH
jgi:hypothetical protein